MIGSLLLRRGIAIVLTLVAVATFTFMLTFLIPAEPARIIVGPKGTEEQIAFVRERLGLNDPLIVQYARYLGDLARFDFGWSYVYDRSVMAIMAERIPWTALLAAGALIVQLGIGVSAGLLLAARAGGIADRVALGWALLQIALPSFWVGVVLLYLFAFRYPIFPLGGAGFPHHLVLPALTMGLPGAAWYSRMVRDTTLEILGSEFVLALRAKGTPRHSILFKHVLRAVISPIVTMMSIDFGYFLGGATLIETVFSWPGLGFTAFQAMRSADIPLLMATVLFGSGAVLLMNLFADIARAVVDPRVNLA